MDADIWIQADAIDDALYRNGSENVGQWQQRVRQQTHLLARLEIEWERLMNLIEVESDLNQNPHRIKPNLSIVLRACQSTIQNGSIDQ